MIILGVIAAAFIIFYMNLDKYGSFVFRLADSFFIIGLIYLLIALAFYIRNVGFFKLLAYGRYRRRNLRAESSKHRKENKQDLRDGQKKMDSQDKPMELHEFYQEHYGEKWSNKYLLIYAIPLLILSFIFSYLA